MISASSFLSMKTSLQFMPQNSISSIIYSQQFSFYGTNLVPWIMTRAAENSKRIFCRADSHHYALEIKHFIWWGGDGGDTEHPIFILGGKKKNQTLALYSHVFCSCHAGIAVLVNSSCNESKWLTSQRCTDFQFLSFLMIILTLGITEQSSAKCLLKGKKPTESTAVTASHPKRKASAYWVFFRAFKQWSAAPE